MSTFLHITRRKFWATKETGDITRAEWERYIQTDPELTHPGKAGPDFTDWTNSQGESERWLYWAGGEIAARSPDGAFIRKMVAIAQKLGAKVQDDDGKLFN